MRTRTIMVGDEPRRVDARLAARFEVVRGILTGALSLRAGSKRLHMRCDALAKLVEATRRQVMAHLAIPQEVVDGSNVTRTGPALE